MTERSAVAPVGRFALFVNQLVQRAALAARAGKQFDGRRNLYEILGYKNALQYDDYCARYERGDIAGQIVDAPAAATWRNAPVVQEDDDETKDTLFEEAWKDIAERLKAVHYCERVDRLAGIGRYAVLLIGVRSGTAVDFQEPLDDGSLSGPGDVIYLAPFSERSAQIKRWVRDPQDPRFGRPEMYEVDFGTEVTSGGLSKRLVHHSRLLHIADGLLEDEVYGRPRLMRVFNRLDDLDKVVGGSAEMFWQGAHKGLQFDLRDDATLPPEDEARLTAEIDEYMHNLRRYIRTAGIDIKPLQGEVANPKEHFEALLSLIAGATRIPKRVLLGAERGELASSQDETNWNAYITERQKHFAEPQVLRPFIDRLIALGALPQPAEPYKVKWPNLFELDEKGKAEVADRKASAIQKYAPFGDTERVMPIAEFREKVLGLEAEPSEEHVSGEPGDDLDNGEEPDEEFLEQTRRARQPA